MAEPKQKPDLSPTDPSQQETSTNPPKLKGIPGGEEGGEADKPDLRLVKNKPEESPPKSADTSKPKRHLEAVPDASESTPSAQAPAAAKTPEEKAHKPGLYKPSKSQSRAGVGGFLRKHRIKLSIALIGFLLSGSVWLFTFLAAPYELYAFSSVFRDHNFGNRTDSNYKNAFERVVFRRYREAPERNLGFFDSKLAARAERALNQDGIRVVYDRGQKVWVSWDGTGQMTGIEVDGTLITPDDLKTRNQKRTYLRTYLDKTNLNKIMVKFVYFPVLKTKYRVNFTFFERIEDPVAEKDRNWGRTTVDKIKNYLQTGDARGNRYQAEENEKPEEELTEEEKKRQEELEAAVAEAEDVSSEYNDRVEGGESSPSAADATIESKISKGLSVAGLVSMACSVQALASQGDEFIYKARTIPLVRYGNLFNVAGSQYQSGDLAYLEEGGALTERLRNEDESWIETAAYYRAIDEPVPNGAPDLPEDASPSKGRLQNFFRSVTTVFSAVPGSETACKGINSPAGQVVLLGAEIAEKFTPLGAARTIVGEIAEDKAFSYLFRRVLLAGVGNSISGDEGPWDLTNMVDAGMNIAANEEIRRVGGRFLTAAEVAELEQYQREEQRAKYASLSLSEKTLSLSNPYSSASKLLRYRPHSLSQSLEMVAKAPEFALRSIIWPLFGVKESYAQSEPFDNYGIPQWGFSLSEWQDTQFEDPEAIYQAVTEERNSNPDKYKEFDKCFEEDLYKAQNNDQCSSTEYDFTRYRFYLLYQSQVAAIDCLTKLSECELAYTPTESGPSNGGGGGGGGEVSGDVRSLAQQILDNSNITYPLDAVSPNGSTRAVLEGLARGEPAAITCPVYGGSSRTTNINVNILKFLVEAGNEMPIGVNALTDKCHSSDASTHYQGNAVDFECGLDVTRLDSIATKYGGARNAESCSTAPPHWHYYFGGGEDTTPGPGPTDPGPSPNPDPGPDPNPDPGPGPTDPGPGGLPAGWTEHEDCGRDWYWGTTDAGTKSIHYCPAKIHQSAGESEVDRDSLWTYVRLHERCHARAYEGFESFTWTDERATDQCAADDGAEISWSPY